MMTATVPVDQVGRERWQVVILTIRPAVFDHHIPTFDKASVLASLDELQPRIALRCSRWRTEKADHRHHRLLRPRRGRPRHRCATNKRDELAPLHSITSSARALSVAGMSRPSALAVCRLMTNSKTVGLHHRQVGGLLTLENAGGVDADLAKPFSLFDP